MIEEVAATLTSEIGEVATDGASTISDCIGENVSHPDLEDIFCDAPMETHETTHVGNEQVGENVFHPNLEDIFCDAPMETHKTTHAGNEQVGENVSHPNLEDINVHHVSESGKDGMEETALSREADNVHDNLSEKSETVIETNNDISHKEEVPQIERTSTPEKQFVDSKTSEEWKNNPENNGKLELGKEHSGETLRKNMVTVMGENPENSAAHHVVGNETPNAAKKLEEYGIDRNDPANGIFLPDSEESELKGSIHNGRHSREYYDEVERRFQNVSSREECLEVLDSIKEDLFNGDLNVNKDNKYNQ